MRGWMQTWSRWRLPRVIALALALLVAGTAGAAADEEGEGGWYDFRINLREAREAAVKRVADHVFELQAFNIPSGIFYDVDSVPHDSSAGVFAGDDDDDDDDSASAGRPASKGPVPVPAFVDRNQLPRAVLEDDPQGRVDIIEALPLGKEPDFLTGLRLAPDAAAALRSYEQSRARYAREPIFYVLSADWFYAHGQAERGRAILESLREAPLWPEVEPALLLARELGRHGDWAAAVGLLRQLEARTEYQVSLIRELAMAEAAAGDPRGGAIRLWTLLSGKFAVPHIFPPHATELPAEMLDEMDRLATMPNAPGVPAAPLPEAMAEGLRPTQQQRLRIVATWPDGDADVDLLVTDPAGTTVHAPMLRKDPTRGRIAVDSVDGDVPEIYRYDEAPAGRYTVTLYYVDSSQPARGYPVLVHVDMYTDYGSAEQTHQRLFGRLMGVGDAVKLTTFELPKPKGTD